MRSIIGICLISVVVLGCHRKNLVMSRISCCPRVATSPTPQDLVPGHEEASIYQLSGQWTDQHGRLLELNKLKGKIQVMAMIFTHCGYACPRIVQDMKAIEDSLSGRLKNDVGFVLVSFDAQRDDPAQLRRFAAQQGLDDRWTLLHGSPGQVRELSMLLGVAYQEAPNGNFSHSNAILILDAGGAVAGTLPGLQAQPLVAGDMIYQIANR